MGLVVLDQQLSLALGVGASGLLVA
jgi:hypothetical protein